MLRRAVSEDRRAIRPIRGAPVSRRRRPPLVLTVLVTALALLAVGSPALATSPYGTPGGQRPVRLPGLHAPTGGAVPAERHRRAVEVLLQDGVPALPRRASSPSGRLPCPRFPPTGLEDAPGFGRCTPADQGQRAATRRSCTASPGASVDKAWEHTTGRPDVVIGNVDSGIKWDDAGAIEDLNNKFFLNTGELPEPQWGTRDPAAPLRPRPQRPGRHARLVPGLARRQGLRRHR